MAESCLEGGDVQDGARAAGIRRRDGHQHFSFALARMVSAWRAGTLCGTPRPRQEHHATFEHERGGDWSHLGYNRSGGHSVVRGLPEAGPPTGASPATDRGDEQPLRPQDAEGQGAGRGSRMRVALPATLLA